MADVLDLSNLDESSVQQFEYELIDIITAEYPSLDLSSGTVLRSLLIRPAAMMFCAQNVALNELRNAYALKTAVDNVDELSDETVEAIASNFRVTRNEGTKARGTLTIVIEQNVTTLISSDTAFIANGVTFHPTQNYVGVISEDLLTDEQSRLITARSDGTYSFTVPVEAETAGVVSVRQGTKFEMDPTTSNVIVVVATEDFDEGSEAETNAQLLARVSDGITASVLANRAQIERLMKDVVPTVRAVSVVGMSDKEMLRDRHSIFHISTGGKVDIYVATRSYPIIRSIEKTATLISTSDRRWQITLSSSDFPGFYTVTSLVNDEQIDQSITNFDIEIGYVKTTNDIVMPEIESIVECGFSRYRYAVITFIDDYRDYSSLSDGDTATYSVNIMGMPDIDTLQSYVNDRDNRNPKADYLIKAVVPILTAITATIYYPSSDKKPDINTVAVAITNAVNSLGFSMAGKLPLSVVISAINKNIDSTCYVAMPIDFRGTIYYPDGSVKIISDTSALEVPDEPAYGVTHRTAMFFTDPSLIELNLQTM